MDFELSRAIERTAALETELTRVERALDEMNAVVRHQINEPFSDGNKHFFHPLTCGNDSSHALLFPFWTGKQVVLKCPDCDFVQTYIPRNLQAAAEDDSDVGC